MTVRCEGSLSLAVTQEEADRRVGEDVEWVRRRVAELLAATPSYRLAAPLSYRAVHEDGERFTYEVTAVLEREAR